MELRLRYLGPEVWRYLCSKSLRVSDERLFRCRWSFNLTLFVGSIFGIAAGGAPSFVGLASLVAVSNVGAGGNIPVDSAVFLGALPILLSLVLLSICDNVVCI